ncbi:MAG: hypothetical protein Tsb002_35230 [Wenzhouxiangellaceae bacterium]
MRNYFLVAAFALLLSVFNNTHAAAARWGADYFPNVALTNHKGETVHFFEDMIKDKVVVINFIYTTCPDVCPLETAQLTKVQKILGDRLGKDIFFYSITIDPDVDTPEVLAEYRERYGAKWMFLTGDEQEIITLRRKLGLYIEDIGGGENNHNVSMIIGNQKTGRWMKRSPFENPHVLADQIGNWLFGWKDEQQIKDYAKAPELRDMSDGENLFRTRCMSCHTIDGKTKDGIGPDLLGVHLRRERPWLIRWLYEPDVMLQEQDPLAVSLFERYNRVAMPNTGLTRKDIFDLLDYIEEETNLVLGIPTGDTKDDAESASPPEPAQGDVVAVMNAWVRQAVSGAKVNAGYMTLVNVGDEDLKLVKVESDLFSAIEIHEMALVDGLMKMQELKSLDIPAGGQAQLKPGNTHLMLRDPAQDLVKGHTVEMVLTFDTGQEQTITVPVAEK